VEEQWRPVIGYPNYSVSNLGKVKNNISGKMIKQQCGRGAYVYVAVTDGVNSTTKLIHRLVAESFMGPHPDLVVNHIDSNKLNNNLMNLEWCTHAQNLEHATIVGNLHPGGYQMKPIKVIETGEIFESAMECANAIGGNVQNISSCLKGRRDSALGLHFEYVDKEVHSEHVSETRVPFLYDYQLEAVMKLVSGNILCGNVGSGKSRTGLYWYFKEHGGSFDNFTYKAMSNPKDLYIITTAKKRDSLEWCGELSPYLLSIHPEVNLYKNKVVIDSWNCIKKYIHVTDAYFLFDEDHCIGSGSWTKSFLKIAKNNKWIILTATPGDTFIEFAPVFIANGFYKNKSEFTSEHVIYSRYSKFPKIEKYSNTTRLYRLRDKIIVEMNYKHLVDLEHVDIYLKHDVVSYKKVMKDRWDVFNNKPIENASALCYILRKVVNSDSSRFDTILDIIHHKRKVIIFYSFDYELDILRNLNAFDEDIQIAELNGHKHQNIPSSDKWVYLVNYAAGAEAWECIRTDTMIFYSQNYSYKTMVQAAGRIDRLNTPFPKLWYYHLKSRANIDMAISTALKEKRNFNETKFVGN